MEYGYWTNSADVSDEVEAAASEKEEIPTLTDGGIPSNLFDRFFCQLCSAVCPCSNDLTEHFLKHHLGYTPYKCCQKNCFAEFSTENSLDFHCALKHGGIKKCHVDNDLSDEQIHCLVQLLRLPNFKDFPSDLQKFFIDFWSSKKRTNSRAIDEWRSTEKRDLAANSSKIASTVFGETKNTYNLRMVAKCATVDANLESSDGRSERVGEKIEIRKGRPYKRVPCQLCKKTYVSTPSQTLRHSLLHLKTESNVEWLYKCLLCGNFKLTNKQDIRQHIIKSHKSVHVANVDLYYDDHTVLHGKEIERVHLLCFPGLQAQKKKSVDLHSRKVFRCFLCHTKVKTSTIGSTLNEHVMEHVAIDNGFKWFYKCLICPKYRCLSWRFMKYHMKFTHDLEIVDLEENNHFASRKSQFEKEISRYRLVAFPNVRRGPKEKIYSPNQCKLCKEYFGKNFLIHADIHLPETYAIDWLFKCLICNNFQTLNYKSLQNHVAVVHNVGDVQLGTHFKSLTVKYAKEIARIRLMAFPPVRK